MAFEVTAEDFFNIIVTQGLSQSKAKGANSYYEILVKNYIFIALK